MAEAKEVEIGPYGKGDGIQKHKVTHKHESNMNENTTLNGGAKTNAARNPKQNGMTETNTDLGDEDDPAFVDTRRGGATHQS